MGKNKKVIVYICTQSLKKEFLDFSSYEEAEKFCEANNWEFIDMNNFHWNLEIQ